MAVVPAGFRKGGQLILCRDCKWWKIEEDWFDRHGRQRGKCELAEEDNQADSMVLLLPWQGADGATLYTVADFGCVQFEARCDLVEPK